MPRNFVLQVVSLQGEKGCPCQRCGVGRRKGLKDSGLINYAKGSMYYSRFSLSGAVLAFRLLVGMCVVWSNHFIIMG